MGPPTACVFRPTTGHAHHAAHRCFPWLCGVRFLCPDKIMEEVDRFQELQLEIEGEKERQVDARRKLIAAHERVIRV